MLKPSLLFLVIAIIAAINFYFNFSTSVVPGWHTYIFPLWSVWPMLVFVWLCLIPIGYWILEKKGKAMEKKIVIWHLILSLFYFVYAQETWAFDEIGATIRMFLLIIFFVGQVIYLYGLFRAIRRT